MPFTHERILRREDGSRVKINAHLGSNRHGKSGYSFEVRICAKGKRTWNSVTNIDCYKYRALSMEDRRAKHKENQLNHVHPMELVESGRLLWESLSPESMGLAVE